MHFDRNPYTSLRKVGKGFSDFKSGIFIGCFTRDSAASMAVKGLRKEDACSRQQGSLSCTAQQHTGMFPACGATHTSNVFYLRFVGQSLLLPSQDHLRLSHTCFCFAVCFPIFSVWDKFRFCNWFCCLGFCCCCFALICFSSGICKLWRWYIRFENSFLSQHCQQSVSCACTLYCF